MRKLGFFNKLIFFLNTIAALLLLVSYILPYLPPKRFSMLSVLSLGVPLLIGCNVLFLVYWLFKLKRQLLLSLVVLLVGFNYITSIYKFSGATSVSDTDNFSVMSYNVRLFNLFNWLPNASVANEMNHFVATENPSILCLQEYHKNTDFQLEDYYKYEMVTGGQVKNGQAIFSKFPIVNSGNIPFENSSNSAIFVDVVRQTDTIRIYNVHLQSSKINTQVKNLNKETSEALTKQIGNAFTMQQAQAERILQHKKNSTYKTIITGDFNNTAYSYVYSKLKGNLKDTFEQAGSGFGKTFEFNYVPLRIDFILVDEAFTVNGFENYDISLSDHFPIKATLR